MRSIRRYAAIGDMEGNRGTTTGLHKETRRARSIALEPLKPPFHFITEGVSRLSVSCENSSLSSIKRDAEIQVNIFVQFEWMTVGVTVGLNRRNCCLNAAAGIINRYRGQN